MSTAETAAPSEVTGIPTLRQLLPLIAVISAGALMVNLDTVVVNVALDTLSRQLSAPLSTVEWVVEAYALALAAAVPLTGWAGHRLGTRRLWISAVSIFVAASALSGLAWSAPSLIVFRALQGLGGGMVLPAGHAIIVRAAKSQRLGTTMSAVNLPLLIGPVLGPVIGGLLVYYVGWRSIFYLNLPICVAVLWWGRRVIPGSDPEPGRRLDIVGLVLLSPGLVGLVFGLSQAGQAGGSSHPALIGFIAGVVLIGAFVARALRQAPESALLDIRLFARRAFASASAIAFLFSFMMQGALILYPLYWQIVRGVTPVRAGLLIGPQGLGSLITVLFIGRLTDRYGPARLAPIGLVIVLGTTLLWARAGPQTSVALLASATFARGFGISFLGTPAYAAAYQSLRPEETPRGTTLYNILQRCGIAFGVAVATLMLDHQLGRALPGQRDALSTSTLSHLAEHGLGGPIAHSFSASFAVLAAVAALTFVPAMLLPGLGRGGRGASANSRR